MSAAKRILHVEAGRSLYGGALQVCYLMEGLKQQGIENILVCPQGSAIAKQARERVERVVEIPMGGDLDVALVYRLLRLIRQHRPDLVHLHSRRGADVFGGIAAGLAGVPVVLSRRVDNPEPHWLAQLKYRLFDKVITISRGIQRVLIDEGVPPHKVTCVPSAVDVQRYQGCCERSWFIKEFGLQDNDRVIAVIAQLIRRKGHRYLLSCLPQVLQQFPDTHCLIFGQGALESEIQAQILELGLEGHAHLLGFRSDLERILPCLDMVVHPAEMEGLGVSLLQAAAASRPIVASRVGGIPEVVRHNVNGYLVDPGQSQQLAQALVALLADPVRADEMGQAGRRLVDREFSIEAMVQGNLDVYQQLLSCS